MKTETCSRCGEEVRWGWREETPRAALMPKGFWMHRDPATDADHLPKFGHLMTPEDWAHIEAELDKPRTREDGTVYTTRTWRSKGKAEASTELEAAVEIPPWEVTATHIERGNEFWPGGCNTIANLCNKFGWRYYATYGRGPRLHATHGTLLGVSDYVVMRMALDGSPKRAVGFWCDTKFTSSWLMRRSDEDRRYYTEYVAGNHGLRAWIKGEVIE